MATFREREGQCLCGAVRVRAEVSDELMACHCTQCQRWTGGGPLYSLDVRGAEVTGAEHVVSYRHSAHGERCHCAVCGSVLWWKMQARPISSITPGLLDDKTGLRFVREIFTDTRAPWMAPVDGAEQTTEAEEMEKLAAWKREHGQ